MPPLRTPPFRGSFLGEIATAAALGYAGGKYIWAACVECGLERWVQTRRSIEPGRKRCLSCAHWKTGRKQYEGYELVWVYANEFFSPMARSRGPASGGYVLEHRLVVAKSLGRNLHSWECVHHKNGIRNDNRLENLELTTMGDHSRAHSDGYRVGYGKGLADGRTTQIAKLQEEVKMLRQQLECGVVL